MRFWREPLLQFFVLGAGLFVLFGRAGERAARDEIVVTAGQIESLAESWRRTWQRPPMREELEGLIEDRIAEEVLYREALALGLDRDDTIVRRRLRQKIEFLSEDLAGAADPTDAELEAYLREHPDRFRVEPRVSFRHVYVSADKRGDAVRRDAERILAELEQKGASADTSALGDPIGLEPEFESLPRSEVAKLFGAEFADSLLAVELVRWAGPIESGYGLHLVLVRERVDGRLPELAEVREAVEREWQEDRRAQAKADFVKRLRERYAVSVERPEGVRGDAKAAAR